jgi:hypothetical protein
MQMELISSTAIPDGLLAAMMLLSEKPRLGVPSWNPAPNQGIDERNCTAVLGLRFRWSEIVSGTVVAPNNVTPANPCAYMGRALPPSAYASAGKAASNNPVTSTLDLTKGFRIGGYLDAQPLASGNVFARAAYGNYAYGVYMASAGFPLSVTLAGADGIAAIHKLSNPNQYSGRQMDSFWGSIPAANVANITAGYNAQRSGTTCHN